MQNNPLDLRPSKPVYSRGYSRIPLVVLVLETLAGAVAMALAFSGIFVFMCIFN